MTATNPKPISTLRRRVLLVSLAAVSAILAAVVARTVMPGAPAGYATGPAGQASPTPTATGHAMPSPSGTQQPPGPGSSKADTATTCYVGMAGVRYRAEPNTMAISYGLAHSGQAFTVKKYVHDNDGGRWAFGDLRGVRMNVYLAANLLNC